jgi:hypothetical protein
MIGLDLQRTIAITVIEGSSRALPRRFGKTAGEQTAKRR